MSRMAGPNSLWTKPGLSQVMQANHDAADAQETHALEDIIAARQRAKARQRPCLRRILSRLVTLFVSH